MGCLEVKIGDRVSAKTVEPLTLSAGHFPKAPLNITGIVTTVLDSGRIFVTEDMTEREYEVVPETVCVIRGKKACPEGQGDNPHCVKCSSPSSASGESHEA